MPDLMDVHVPYSTPEQFMPEVHGLVGSPLIPSIGALLSAPTQPILELLFTKPSKDVRLIDIICSHHVHEACGINTQLHCMYEY